MWVEGLELLRKMQGLDLKYDQFTLSASLRACTGLSAIALGKQVHAYILRTVYDITSDVHLQSTLVEMYGKNGMVEKAWNVFKFAGLGRQEDGKRDIIMWTSMLSVYGRNGCYKRVIELYNQMLMEGIKPDRVAFVTVISACGHTGEVNLGVQYFDSMQSDFGLEPGQEHYSCLADLLCRAGELEKAWKLVNDIKSRDYNVSLWGALLRACLEQGNIKLGNLAARRALELDPQNTGILVMLSNLYAGFGLWNEIEHLRESVRKEGLYKDVACSWIEITSNKANNETVITILARLEDDVKTTKDHCQQRLYPRRGTDGLLVKAILYRFKLLRAFSALTEVFPSNIHKFHFTD
ncbi:hypothetical protein Csa_006753 [Cucumis sativus]|nr:hypothetical protein Csa_006753 [Cucumis sativus]